ncbi:hypothetical protein [Pseudacidovorax sp. RU35E]|uniref:hypothetical protein n=1 Tax=Pseudacidovorax sp. RU35E TaxID=1907403 RepID=UPI00095476C2|nr:hypothetical protein [Pseudacidovorax sp. RU35E]SIR57255.1 hypothetical protein SAMN05880557_113146 [Pseudacidovorax sp. RU35E]
MRRRNSSSAGVAVLAALAACSPVFNWRDVPLGDGLLALLPCKPDRAQRDVDLAGRTVSLEMAGCAAGDATFAVARMDGGSSPAEAQQRMEAWRASARAPWRARGQVQETPGRVPGAAQVPASVDLVADGDTGSSTGVQQASMRWFARADGAGRYTLYQATVLGRPSDAQALETFWEGLRLR